MGGVVVDGLLVVRAQRDALGQERRPLDALFGEAVGDGNHVVGPVEDDAVLPGFDGAGGDVGEVERAGVVELGEEVEAGLQVVERSAVGERAQEEPVERGAGFGGLAVEGHRPGELRIGQLVERGDLAVLGLVVADHHDAGVVGDPQALGVLLVLGDVGEALHLVGREVVGRLQRHVGAEVEHVGRLVGALVGVGGGDLLLRGGVRGLLVDLDAVLGLEALDDGAVVGPVVRQGDDVELALGLRGGDQPFHPAEVGGGRRGRGVDGGRPRRGRIGGLGGGGGTTAGGERQGHGGQAREGGRADSTHGWFLLFGGRVGPSAAR